MPYASIYRKILKNFLRKKSGEWAITKKEKKDKTNRATGAGRRTRQEIDKWNQIIALASRQQGDIKHPRPPFGGYDKVRQDYVYFVYDEVWQSFAHDIGNSSCTLFVTRSGMTVYYVYDRVRQDCL